jgi:hypothetical protein
MPRSLPWLALVAAAFAHYFPAVFTVVNISGLAVLSVAAYRMLRVLFGLLVRSLVLLGRRLEHRV